MQYRVIYITTEVDELRSSSRVAIARVNEEEVARIEKGWPDYLKWIDQSIEKEITA